MSEAINNRYEFVLLFDVKNGNPNGDPDAGNMPRLDPETGRGIVTDVCLKRKIRNFVELTCSGKETYNIYVKENSILAERRTPAYEAVKDMKDGADKITEAKRWMCRNFFDVRTFGAVMSTTLNNCGQVRGPVQFAFGESVEEVCPLEACITRMAVETSKDTDKTTGDSRTMGRKTYVPYGLYRVHGFISAPLAKQTGFTEDDLKLFWSALQNMFDHDRSASRGEMATRKLIVFKHASELGNAPAHKLFDTVKVVRNGASQGPARGFADYDVVLAKNAVPSGVEMIEMV
jgi:CRISPR-associated protein Csd2